MREGLETVFDRIHRREYYSINIEKACNEINIYSGPEAIHEFNLASQLHLIRCGETIHNLKLKEFVPRVVAATQKTISIVTYSSGRELADIEKPDEPSADHPLYLRAERARRFKGLWSHSDFGLDDLENWIEINQQAIDTALNNSADVTCLGEFDFPPSIETTSHDHKKSIALKFQHRKWILDRLDKLDRPAFVFAGSSHCWSRDRKVANIGQVFARLHDTSQQGFVTFAHRHEKRTSARTLGESLTPCPVADLQYFGTDLGRIGVLICVDAFDPGIVNSAIANSRKNNFDRMQILLVPSYNPSSRLLKSCQQLSALANTTVVYVNAFRNPRHAAAQIFVCGVPVGRWRTQIQMIDMLIQNRIPLDQRVLAEVPGLSSLKQVVEVADAGRGLNIEKIGGDDRLIKWTIPQTFFSLAAQVMSAKQPLSQARLLSSLVSGK